MNTKCKNKGSFVHNQRRIYVGEMLPYEAIAICHNLSDDNVKKDLSEETVMEAISILLGLDDFQNVTRQALLNAAKLLWERLEKDGDELLLHNQDDRRQPL